MPVNLQENNSELIKACWTAMDQTYGTVKNGFNLQPIDNAGHGRVQPWTTPPGYVVQAVIEDKGLGGKFTIYKNEQTNTVLVNAIGTNGNEDAVGWYSNLKDFGLSQWQNKEAKDKTFIELSKVVDPNTKVIINGDSKGMALSNFIVHDLVKERDAGRFAQDHRFSNLDALKNDNLAIVGRVGPGVTDILKKDDPSFNPNDKIYAGISVDYRAPKMQDGSKTELVHQLGGDSINGNGQIKYFSTGVVEQPGNPIEDYAYLHRLTNAAYDHIEATKGDFSDYKLEPRSMMNIGELASYGSAWGSLGQGPTVSTTEAKVRMGTELVCGVATSPLSSLQSMIQGKFSPLNTVIGLGTIALESTPLGRAVLLGGCAVGVVSENGAKFMGAGIGGGLLASDTSEKFAVETTGAPEHEPAGTKRAFGRTTTGEMYVLDTGAEGSTSHVFGNN